VVLVGALVAAALYAAGWWRLRRRGRADIASGPRALLFGAGLLVVVMALLSPIDPIGEEYLFSAHMLQHVMLGDIGPLLIVLGLAGPLALFVVPRPALRTVARRPPLRAVARAITNPAVAVTIWIVAMVGWHIPAAFAFALDHRWAHDLEHLSFFVAGMLAWIVILGAVPKRRLSHGRRAAIAVGLLVVGMVVSQAIFLADPLYDAYIQQPERLLGLSPKGDQVRAAMLMSADQLLTLGTAAALLLWAHVERAEREARAEAAAAEQEAEEAPGPGGAAWRTAAKAARRD
jgi:putative membrane protein